MENITMYNPKLGEVEFAQNGTNVEIPTTVEVVGASARNKYVEGIATDEVSKITLTCVDVKASKAAQDAGLPTDSMPTIQVEIRDIALVAKLKDQADKLIGQKLLTSDAKIALRWISRGNSGNWGGLKLVMNQIRGAQK